MNGWQRLGLVGSLIWLPAGFFWGSSWWIHQNGDYVVEQLKACAGNLNNPDVAKCYSDFGPRYSDAVSGHWWAAFAGAVVPVVLMWCLCWAAVAVWRWVARGGFT